MPSVAVLALVAALQAAAAPSPSPSPAPCSRPEHRQFDFWLGEWDVTNAAQPRRPPARSRITRILDGCAIFEEFENPQGYAGKSLNFYDAAARKWRQTWIDNQGAPLFLEGTLQGASMVLQDKAESGVLNRITWTPVEGGKARQHWQASKDGGTTWQTVFDGLYASRASR